MKTFLPLLMLAAFSGCDKIDYIEIKPEMVELRQPNNEVWLSAKAMSREGREGLRILVGWSSADPSIATVDPKGKVKPVKSGHTEIIAKYKGVEARVPVDVLYVEKIEVEPKEVTLTWSGPSTELHTTSFDYRGKVLKDRNPTYSVADKHVASMGQNAVFPLNPGKTEVTVQVGDIKASVQVTVEDDKKGAAPKK